MMLAWKKLGEQMDSRMTMGMRALRMKTRMPSTSSLENHQSVERVTGPGKNLEQRNRLTITRKVNLSLPAVRGRVVKMVDQTDSQIALREHGLT